MDIQLRLRSLLPLFIVISFGISLPIMGFAQPSCPAVINPSVQKQIENNQFVKDRTLDEYAQNFMPMSTSFYMLLSSLPKGSIFVDMGAGNAKALKQALEYYPQITLGVAISHTRPANFEEPTHLDSRFEYIDGDYVENMMAKGTLDHLKGRVRFMTDFFGPFSYSADLPRLIQAYMDLLEVHGRVFVHFSEKKNVVKKGNQEMSLIDWLKTIPGIVVQRQTDKYAGHGSFFIQKVQENVVVPQKLEIKKHEFSGGVPVRFFNLN